MNDIFAVTMLTRIENWKVYGTYALIGILGWKVVTAIHWKWRAKKNQRKGNEARISRNTRWTLNN